MLQGEPGAPDGGRSPKQVAATPLASALARTELQHALQEVCQQAGWSYGEAWSPCPDGTLQLLPAWYGADPGLASFRRPTEALRFMPGVGLPSRVLGCRQAVLVADVASDPAFCRPSAARKAGLVAGIGVPVLAEGTVVAVLVFFGRATELSGWPKLMQLARAAAERLGSPANTEEPLRAAPPAPA
jgi:two-component system sensor histidine kinase/response regulator